MNGQHQKQPDVARPASTGTRERPVCLFKLDVGNRKGKKIKQEELSENGKTVVLNSEPFADDVCICVASKIHCTVLCNLSNSWFITTTVHVQ